MQQPLIFQNLFYDVKSGAPLAAVQTQNYTLFQVADSYYLSDFHIDGHKQPCHLEITQVLHGSIACGTDGVFLRVEKGEGYLSFAEDIHALTDKNSCRFQTLALNVNNDSPSLPLLDKIRYRYDSPEKRKYKIAGVSTLLSFIVSEFSTSADNYFERALDGAITSLLTALARGERDTREFRPYPNKELLSDILRYVDEHFLTITSLFELSEKFGYSYNYLCSLFKKLHGTTLREYLLSKKLNHAANLLKQGKKVSEVSDTTGYSSPYNFSRAFKKHFGVSPENLRKK